MKKVICGITTEKHEKDITMLGYQDIRVDNYQCEKRIFLGNTTSYIDLILEALKKRFKEWFKALKN